MVIINAGSMGVSPMADTISYQAHFHGQDAPCSQVRENAYPTIHIHYFGTLI